MPQFICFKRHCIFYSMLLVSLLLGSLPLAHASGEPTGPIMNSCRKAADPDRCEARITARKACRDKRSAEKIQCINNNMPPPDCSKAQDPKRCIAQQRVKACKGKKGKSCKRMQKAKPATQPAT